MPAAPAAGGAAQSPAPADPAGAPPGAVGGTARAAALMGVLTLASRFAGFARLVVFVWAVGETDLGDAYHAANTVPNVVFEIVAGGALASLVVPLLARAVAAGDRRSAAATASALLTWVVTLLVPVAVAVALAAPAIIGVFLADLGPAARDAAATMLRIFAPQLPLYGVGIVLTGVLQSYRRFAWPVLAPLLSSLTVMAAYVAYAAVGGQHLAAADVGRTGLLILAVGTTLGVAVLSLCLLVPLRRLGLRLRPTYRVGAQAAPALRRLAGAGLVTVAAQQAALVLAIALAAGGPPGSVVRYGLAQTLYLLPWAVLALPVATSAYPALAAAAAGGDHDTYRRTLAAATRGALLVSALGAAALAALAPALAALLAFVTDGGDPAALATAVAWFAPGLPGYALFALLSRALYARGDAWLAATATAAGWGAVALASLAFAATVPDSDRVAALAAANSVGMLVLGGCLLAAVARRAGVGALAGTVRAAVAALAAAGAAAAAGTTVWHLCVTSATPGAAATLTPGMLSGVTVAAVFTATAYLLDRRDVHPVLAGASARARRLARR